MRSTPRLLMCLYLALSAWSCATSTGASPRDRNVISPEEIQDAGVRNAYELVERLRPLWLLSRGDRSTHLETNIVVYQDDSMLGNVELLRGIPIELVRSVRSLDSAQAGRLPGLGGRHVERAIVVITRPNP
jgi:hypothetical protein